MRNLKGLSKVVPNAVSSRIGRQLLKTQKHSPTILFATGVVGVVATTVVACRSTLKLDEVLETAETKREKAHKALELNVAEYTEKDFKKDLTVIQVHLAADLVKLYGPAVVLGSLSIAALTGSHNILSKRNAGLSAAYAATEKAFREYRERVTEKYGDDIERELRYGTEEHTVLVEDKNGPKKKDVTTYPSRAGNSMYAKLFNEANINHGPNRDVNLMFLRFQQQTANDILQSRGHIFLNEVYDMLGFDHTPAGSQVGWLKDGADGRVDFGIWSDKSMARLHDFMVGIEDELLLDFNVDGEIWRMI